MSREKQIEENGWNNDVYKTITLESNAEIDEVGQKFMENAKAMHKLAELINTLCPKLSKTIEGEELAVTILSSYPITTDIDVLVNGLYRNGYRKASEVAEEIFGEIHEALDDSVETEHFKGSWFNMNKFTQKLAELKKKYTEGGE